MYELIYSDEVLKQLKKSDNILKKRIIATLERMRFRPHSYTKKLVGSPYFSLRVGDHRIILDIQDNKLIIFVIELGHRRNIYKK